MDRGYVNKQIQHLLAENQQLRDQLVRDLAIGEDCQHRLNIAEVKLAEAEAQVEKLRKALDTYYWGIPEDVRKMFEEALK